MSIAPQAIWFERFELIGTTIEAHADNLTARWAERAIVEQDNATAVFRQEMRDRLPDLLRAMGRSLARSNNSVPAPHTVVALEHGEQRWQIGWKLVEVIRDYQILRLVIAEYLDEVLEKPLQAREAMAIGLALDEAITASVLAYVGYQEIQLREANRRLTDFLPVLGHELRNPLAAIVASMELIHMAPVPEGILGEAHDIIDRQLEQLIRLVNDISDVSRIMRGQLELRPTRIDLRQVLQQSIEAVNPTIVDREHSFDVSVPSDEVWVEADTTRLQQVLTNLLQNAAKYTPPKGQIKVAIAINDNQAVVRVRDNGVGIAHSELAQIFEMFSQGPGHKHQGLGIGLGLVRALVELHGGKVTVHSEGAGQGSEFVVELPLAHAAGPQAPAESTSIPSAETPRFRILLVDDHVDGAQTFAALLDRCGHEVRIAHDGPQALAIAGNWQPEVILIDIGLPGMNGYELTQTLRRDPKFRQTLLVALTGYANENDRRRAEEAGCDQHLSKPVELESVQKLLAAFAGKR